MPTAQSSIHVEASPQEVFDLVSDPLRIPEYVPIVIDVFEVSDGPIGVGTVIKEHTKPGPVVTVTRWEIVEYLPPHKHVWSSRQWDMEMILTKEIRPDGSGTSYEQSLHYRLMPRLRPLGRLLEMVSIERKLQNTFDQVVAGIKAIAEEEHRVSAARTTRT